MPQDEKGQKWACVVCIKGHRAPKCNHFERYMTRVRNPGRPLTTCPHIQDDPSCDCKRGEAVIMMKIFKGSQCLCTPAPDNSSTSTKGDSKSKLEHGTDQDRLDTSMTGWQQEFIDLDSSTEQATAGNLASNGHEARQSQDSPYHGHISDLQHSRSPYTHKWNTNPTNSPYRNPTPQVINGQSFLPQQPQLSSPLDLHASFATTHASPFGSLYSNPLSMQFGANTATQGAFGNYQSREMTPSVNSIHSSGISPQIPKPGSDYQSLGTSNDTGNPPNSFGGLPWNNGTTATPFNYPLAPPIINAMSSMNYTPQGQSFPQVDNQSLSTPFTSVVGAGASAAEENRAHRYREHECTCGAGCGCLACPTHPYNDTTKQEALQVGRLLSQDPVWNNFGDLEKFDPTQSDVLKEAILSGEEWLDAPYAFPWSDLMSQNLVTTSQGSNCCLPPNLDDEKSS